MSIDIKKAFKFTFKSPDWQKKLLVGGGITFLAVIINEVLSFFYRPHTYGAHPDLKAVYIAMCSNPLFYVSMLIMTLINAFVIGYVLQSAHNEIKNEEPLLPEWKSRYSLYFKNGIIYTLLLYPYYILSFIWGVFIGFFIAMNHVENGFTISIVLACCFGVAFAIILPFIKASYAENFNWKDAFNLKRIFSLIMEVPKEYFLNIGLVIALTLGSLICVLILTCTCIGILLAPVVGLLCSLIITNLFAQTYKLALQKSEKAVEVKQAVE